MNIYLVISSSYTILRLFYSYTCMKPNILISMKDYLDKYAELLKLIKNVSPFVNKIILDSGGFSTFDIKDVKVAEIMKNKYLNFIEKYYNYTHETFEYIFAFDYIHGRINFKLNYEWFDEQCSVNEMVVPVVHNISKDSKEVDEYSVYHPKHIAIGKCQNKTGLHNLSWVVKKSNRALNRFTSEQTRLYSCRSSLTFFFGFSSKFITLFSGVLGSVFEWHNNPRTFQEN